jgi:hypothetical protein
MYHFKMLSSRRVLKSHTGFSFFVLVLTVIGVEEQHHSYAAPSPAIVLNCKASELSFRLNKS